MKAILGKAGYDIIEARNGVEGAWKYGEEDNIKLVFLDIMMPGGDGRKFLELTQVELLNKKTPICILSAIEEQKCIIEYLELGAHDYLIKPIDRDILLDKAEYFVKKLNISFAQLLTDFNIRFQNLMDDFKVISLSESFITIQTHHNIALPASAVIEKGRIHDIAKTVQPIIGRFSPTMNVDGKFLTRFYFIGLKEVFRKNIRTLTVRGGELDETA